MTSPARIGSYRIERLLGTGSFGTVWLGHDPALDAHVAIKVLAENWCHDLRVRERFLDEARLLWRLDHERIVRVYAIGELPDGRPYLVMAWADGGSLRDRLAAGPVPVPAALALLREIAAGVAVLHDHGIVHRDLTPGNILFRSGPERTKVGSADARVLIADLGLAKALAAASGLTARAGTPGYMAPEQDDPLAVVDTRADVYGLGRLGVRLLGAPAAGRSGGPPRLRDGVPPGIAAVLRTATAQRPADRYADARAFGAALDRAGATTRRPTGPPRGSPRRWAVAAAAAVLAAATVAGLAADSAGAPGTVVDETGRISVVPPVGWRATGDRWAGRVAPDGRREPALVLSPAPERWGLQRDVPGAFVGLSRGIGARSTPAAWVAEQRRPGCAASPVRTTRQAGMDWVVARHSACPGINPVIVETAARGPRGAGLVYVQVVPPAGSGPEFVDALLGALKVR